MIAPTPVHARPKKYAIIGDGHIGMELLKNLTMEGAADHIMVYNRNDDKWNPKRKEGETPEQLERRINQVRAFNETLDQANIALAPGHVATGYSYSTDLAATIRDADVVIVTSGQKRTSDKQSRTELGESNYPLIDSIAKVAAQVNPTANYIIATNPVDMVTQRFQQTSGINPQLVMGLSGELDRTRMIQSISHQLKISPDRILDAHVGGEHGGNMMPLLSKIKIRAQDGHLDALSDILSRDPAKKANILDATINGGAKLIKLRGESDWVGPAAALTKMVNEIAKAKRGEPAEDLWVSALNEKEGVFTGQQVKLGNDGKHTVVPMDVAQLSPDEQKAWASSIDAQRKAVAKSREGSFSMGSAA